MNTCAGLLMMIQALLAGVPQGCRLEIKQNADGATWELVPRQSALEKRVVSMAAADGPDLTIAHVWRMNLRAGCAEVWQVVRQRGELVAVTRLHVEEAGMLRASEVPAKICEVK